MLERKLIFFELETDWKILVIDVKDPKASEVTDAASLEKAYPGALKSTFEFLRDYKIPAGSGPNNFAFDSELKDEAYAQGVIEETHHFWKALFAEGGDKKAEEHSIGLSNSLQTSHKISADDAKAAAKL